MIRNMRRAALCSAAAGWRVAVADARADEHAGSPYVPYKASGIYAQGETVGWNVTLPWNAAPADYVIRKNNLDEIGRGHVRPGGRRRSK